MKKAEMRNARSYKRERVYATMVGTLLCMLAILVKNCASSARHRGALVEKCCPPDQVLSVEENFTCAYSRQDRRLYYTREQREWTGTGNVDFAGCDDTENLTITSLTGSEIDRSLSTAVIACIDLLWDKQIGQSIPIVFRCVLREPSNATYTNEKTSLTVDKDTWRDGPILASLRVCCDPDTTYDLNERHCVYGKNNATEDIAKYFKILREKFHFLSIVRGPPKCEHAIVNRAVNATRDIRILDDGRLEIALPTRNGSDTMRMLADEENSCIDIGGSDDPVVVVVRVCSSPEYCETNSCVRKCCAEEEALVEERCGNLAWRGMGKSFHQKLVNASIGETGAVTERIDPKDYGLLIGKPCKYGMFPVDPSEGWYLTRQGRFNLPLYRIYEHDEYCMDLFYEKKNDWSSEALAAFVCFDEPKELIEESSLRYWIFAVLQLTSCLFLGLTLLVYACLPVLRNLHGKTLMCHVGSLMMAYATLAVVGLATPPNTGDPYEQANIFCKFLGFTLLLSWTAAFTWLNVMCFDIWWTFGGQGAANSSVVRQHGGAYKKRFLLYSLYAWGISALTTTSAILADRTEALPIYLRPHIGCDSCWFERNILYYGEMLFFVGPVSIQLLANVVFFAMTAIHCGRIKAEIARLTAGPNDPRSKRFRADRTRLMMNLKLFAVMGISWSLEVISAYLNHWASTISWQTEFFYASDVFNCLQGLLIFLLFGMKRRVYRSLMQRFCAGRRERNGKTEETRSGRRTAGALGIGDNGIPRDPYRLRNSASSSTIVSTYGAGAGASSCAERTRTEIA